MADGRVAVFTEKESKWQPFSEVATTGGTYSFQLPEGKYYLAYKIPGYLASRTKPFEVKGDSAVNLETGMLYGWIAYGILLGGIVVLILFILKYTRRRTRA